MTVEKIRKRKCDFQYGDFVCELEKHHLSDHKQGRFAMFNPDQYVRCKGAKSND